MKNEIDNLKPQVEKNTKNIANIFEQIDIIFGRLNDMKSLINTNNDLINADVNDKVENLKKWVSQKLDEYNKFFLIFKVKIILKNFAFHLIIKKLKSEIRIQFFNDLSLGLLKYY